MSKKDNHKSKTTKVKKPIYKRLWFIILLALTVLIIIIATTSGGDNDSDSVAGQPPEAGNLAPEVPETPEVVGPTRDNSMAVQTTLFTGTFMVGQDIPEGRYVITADGFGNFFVYDGELPIVNALLNDGEGDFGVPSLTIYLHEGNEIEISGINNVTFTPAATQLVTVLTAGDWIVGLDILPGTYDVFSTYEESGNFFVFSADILGLPLVNEILGGEWGVERVRVNLEEGQRIQMHNISSVTFEQP